MPKPLPDDPVLRAHFRRQRDWAKDAPALMAGPTAREEQRQALLAALDRRDNERRKAARTAAAVTIARSARKTAARTQSAAKPARKARPAAKTKTTKSTKTPQGKV
ncbi:MAG: hypothetical protein C0605_15910 [Hyphomicrobiales bacterium]|nr:MAG: hypothetical protein C0605_15910 [Hyphomicrobiales bacterium]